jgi:hypothetical protein
MLSFSKKSVGIQVQISYKYTTGTVLFGGWGGTCRGHNREIEGEGGGGFRGGGGGGSLEASPAAATPASAPCAALKHNKY